MLRSHPWLTAVVVLALALLACSTGTAPSSTPVVVVVTATSPLPTSSPAAAVAGPTATATVTTKAPALPSPTRTNTPIPPASMPTNTPVLPSATPTHTSVPPSPTPTTGFIVVTPGIVIPPGGIKLLPKTQQVLNQISVAANVIGHAVATCPSGSVVTGGGYAASKDLYVYNSSQSGNGWEVYAKNTSGASFPLNAYAICLSNTAGASTQVYAQVSVPGGDVGHAVAACPAGSVVTGGGYAAKSDKSLFVYNSSRSGNGWQVYARNTTSANQLLNAYATCLSGTNGTVQQVLNQISAPSGSIGHAVAACPSGTLVTGGGFAGNTNLYVYNTSMEDNNQWETYAQNLSGSSQTLNSYAICIKFP